jgi:two-component system phosphate regulon sensor histidine kinase PhoR
MNAVRLARSAALFIGLFSALLFFAMVATVPGAFIIVIGVGGIIYFFSFLLIKHLVLRYQKEQPSNQEPIVPSTKEKIVELQEKDEFRKEFIGNVSHELRTPLFNIQGYIDTLIDGAMDDPKVNKEYLYKAAKSVDRLNAIVRDLEDITMLEGGLQLHKNKIDIRLLTQEVADSLSMLADANDITIQVQTGKPVWVLADHERIRQVLDNLLDNSIKYGQDEGKVDVSYNQTNGTTEIIVSDNGIGIEPNHLPRIFERFYRVDASRSREHGDTGLGLSIVKHIIEAHDQSIEAQSTKGEGTTFTFTLETAK